MNDRTRLMYTGCHQICFISTVPSFCSGWNVFRGKQLVSPYYKQSSTTPRTMTIRQHQAVQCCQQQQGKNDDKYSHYTIYKSYHRLIGAPKVFALPLHVCVHALPVSDELDGYSFDMIPENATQLSTLLKLIRGECVWARVRVRPTARSGWRDSVKRRRMRPFVVDVNVDHEERKNDLRMVIQYAETYKGCVKRACSTNGVDFREGNKLMGGQTSGLSLYKNNCWRFADDIIGFMLE